MIERSNVQAQFATTVTADTPCRRCAYNLRGLPLNGRCPECNVPVAVSTAGNHLRYSEPRWVATLLRGVNVIVTGVAMLVLGPLAFVVMGMMLDDDVSGGLVLALSITLGLIVLAGYACLVVGSWFVTAPDPSGVGEDQYGTARKIIRITLLIGVAQVLIAVTGSFVAFPREMRIAFGAVGIVSTIAGVVGLFAQLAYFSKLAVRIPDAALAARANFLKYALGIPYVLIVLVSVAVQLIPPTGAGGGTGLACFMLLLALMMLVFGIMYLLMLGRFGRAFKEQLALSKQIWQAA